MITYTQASGPRRGAVACGLAAVVAAASLGGAPTANAWCVGLFGVNSSGDCHSTPGLNFSLGLGPNAVASSDGFLTGAIAVGEGTNAAVTGFLTAAWAGGTGSEAAAQGIIAWAVAQGSQADAVAGALPNDLGNVAINFGGLGPLNTVHAGGTINLAANLGGNATEVQAFGILNNAINVGGSLSHVTAGNFAGRATFTSASNFFGIDNIVDAGEGPAAVASAFGSTGPVTLVDGPGIAINNFRIGGGTASSTTSVLAAGNKVAPTTLATGSVNKAGRQVSALLANANSQLKASLTKASKQLNGSLTKASKQVSSSLNSLNKKVADTVSKVTKGTKAGADKTNGSSGDSSNGGASAS